MSCKIYTVTSAAGNSIPIFLVNADHEQHARDMVRDVLGKAAFKAKLKNGETEYALVEAASAYSDGRVLPLVLSDDEAIPFNVSQADVEVRVIESTQTVRLILHHIKHKEENNVNLIAAVAEESKLARAYRRHRDVLEGWINE